MSAQSPKEMSWDDLNPADIPAAEASVAASKKALDGALERKKKAEQEAFKAGYAQEMRWDDLTPTSTPAQKGKQPFTWASGKTERKPPALKPTLGGAKPAATAAEATAPEEAHAEQPDYADVPRTATPAAHLGISAEAQQKRFAEGRAKHGWLLPGENIKDERGLDERLADLARQRAELLKRPAAEAGPSLAAVEQKQRSLSQIKNDIARLRAGGKASAQAPSEGGRTPDDPGNLPWYLKGAAANLAHGAGTMLATGNKLILGGERALGADDPALAERIRQGDEALGEIAERGGKGVVAEVERGIAGLAGTLPYYSVGGVPGMAAVGGLEAAGEADPADPVKVAQAALTNAAMGKVLHGTGEFKLPARVLTGGAVGAATAIASGASREQTIAQAILFGGLGAMSGKGGLRDNQVKARNGRVYTWKDNGDGTVTMKPVEGQPKEAPPKRPAVNLMEAVPGKLPAVKGGADAATIPRSEAQVRGEQGGEDLRRQGEVEESPVAAGQAVKEQVKEPLLRAESTAATEGVKPLVAKESARPANEPLAATPTKPQAQISNRADLHTALMDKFGYDSDTAHATAGIAEARARAWAKETGQSTSAWYESRLSKVGDHQEFIDTYGDPREIAARLGYGEVGQAKGVSLAEGGRGLIYALEAPDRATAVHEMAHIFRKMDLTPENLKTAEEWLGVEGGNWEMQHEERFARGFEKYLAEGKAPTEALRRVFEQFRNWMVEIYSAIKGLPVGGNPIQARLTPEVREMFDGLLGGERRVADTGPPEGMVDRRFEMPAGERAGVGQAIERYTAEPSRALPDLVAAYPQSNTQVRLEVTREGGQITDEQIKSLFPDYDVSVRRTGTPIRPGVQGIEVTFWDKQSRTRQVKPPADWHERIGLAEPMYRGQEPVLAGERATPSRSPKEPHSALERFKSRRAKLDQPTFDVRQERLSDDDLRDLTEIGADELRAGNRSFAAWSEGLLKQIGEHADEIKPHLGEIFARARGELKQAETAPAGQRERSLPATLEAHGMVGGDERYYTRIGHKETLKAAETAADELIGEKGADGAVEWIRGNERISAHDVATSEVLIDRLMDQAERLVESNPAEADRLMAKANEAAGILSERMTRAGQGVSAVRVLERMHPTRIVGAAQRILDRVKPGKRLPKETADSLVAEAKIARSRKQQIRELEKDPVANADKIDRAKRDLVESRKRIARTLEGLDKWGAVKRHAGSLVSGLRSIKTSWDLSAPGRQGWIFAVLHPYEGGLKPFGKQLKALGGIPDVETRWGKLQKKLGARDYKEMQAELFADPDAQEMMRLGSEMTGTGSQTATALREEPFRSNWAERVPGVARSEQAFSTFLNYQRLQMYKMYKGWLTRFGVTPESAPNEYAGIVRFINDATGRGTLAGSPSLRGHVDPATFRNALRDAGKGGGMLRAIEKSPVATQGLFAYRWLKSRLNLMNPVYYAKLPKAARLVAMAEMTRFVGTLGLTGYLATKMGGQVSLDPDDADFLKVRFGNTHYDLSGGFQNELRFIFRTMKAAHDRYTGATVKKGGETYRAGPYNTTEGRTSGISDIGLDFLRSKAAPLPGAVADYATGEMLDYDEQTGKRKPFSWGAEALNLIEPMVEKDMREAWAMEGAKGAVKALPTVGGIGVQTYPPRKKAFR